MKAFLASAAAALTLLASPLPLVHGQPTYSFITFAGQARVAGSADGTGTNATFSDCAALAVDATGNLYVADGGNQTIRKLTSAGVVSTLAGLPTVAGTADGAGATARFNQPISLAVDRAGNLYVADARNHTIRKVTAAGVVTTLAGRAGVAGSADGPGATAQFNDPEGIAVDGSGTLYVADRANYTIRKISPDGIVSTFAGTAGVSGWPVSADGIGAAATFAFPTGLAVDPSGNVLVADYFAVRKISPAGVVTTIAGSNSLSGATDGVGASARFYGLRSCAVDPAGNLLVADANHLIRSISPGGVVTTVAGQVLSIGCSDGIGGGALFSSWCGLAFDASGHLWVADGENDVIRRGTPTSDLSPPIITTYPSTAGTNVVAGSTATFSVPVSAIAPASFQWSKNDRPISGATGAVLTLANVTPADAGLYAVTASNRAGSVRTPIGSLVVTPAPMSSFTTRHVQAGGRFLWGIAAGNGALIAVGAEGTVLTSDTGVAWIRQNSGTTEWLTGVAFGAGRFVAVGDHGRIQLSRNGVDWTPARTTATAQRLNNLVYGDGLFVAVGEAGTIVTSPDGRDWTARPSVATGWLRGVAYTASVGPQIPHYAVCGQGGQILTSADGLVWRLESSDASSDLEAIVAVNNYASFIAVGQSEIVEGALHPLEFRNLTFYQFSWQRRSAYDQARLRGIAAGANACFATGENGTLLLVPTMARFSVDTTANLVAGTVVGNTLYVVGENETILASSPLYQSRLVNLSSRGRVGAGEDALISGFVVQGASPKQILLRAVGPTLIDAGVSGALTTPTLTLYDQAGLPLATNTRWSTATNASALAPTMQRVGAFALPAASADSALLVTLAPGLYTTHVTGAAAATGVALLEVYDTDALVNDGTKAINISTRGQVGTGADRLIAGFVIAGDSARRVLLRAAGPSLAAMGVTGALAEPELTLYAANGSVLQTAQAWNDQFNAAEIRDAAIRTGAFPFADGSKDAALVVTLMPGVYSLHVTGKNGTTGIAMAEVYDLP